ncbi:MAG: TonB-dependent receptor, partial [Opitutaceae bacterium]
MNTTRFLTPSRQTWLAAPLLALIATATSLAQIAPAPAPDVTKGDAKKPGQVVTGASPPKESKDEVVELSPFQVVSDAKGYFQANTMSGTRLNSNIEDLGQSITVMTKEQMADFAMLDINDVFDHMASTEGTSSYSDFALDRTGAVTDNVSGDPNNANRVRGIGSANIAFGNIATTGRVPVDPLWMDSIELSRGPNANIFGLGNAGGTVNQVPATANVSRDFTKVGTRGDSYGGWRGSLDVNRSLIKNQLAVRASYANQHTGFVRKPSGEDARRLSLQLKAKPFKNTTVSLSWYGYNNASVRPNYTTPRDYITDWFKAGKPAWNPVTRLITLNGVTYGQGMVAGSATPITTLPSYFTANDSRAVFRIGGPGEAPYWTTPTVTATTTPLTTVGNNIRFVNTPASSSFFGSAQPLFASTPALSDKSIYDWEDINLMSNGKAWDKVNTYVAQLDQILISTPKHLLAGQVTFMREDAKR